MRTNSLASFNACTARKLMRAPGGGLQSSTALLRATAGEFGRKRQSGKGQLFTLRSASEPGRSVLPESRQESRTGLQVRSNTKERIPMDTNNVEILLVEDNPNDVELTLDALKE